MQKKREYPALGKGVRIRSMRGVRLITVPLAAKTAFKAVMNLVSRHG
jgi:hypothetical protein